MSKRGYGNIYQHPFPGHITPPPVTAHLDGALHEEIHRILGAADIHNLEIGEEFEKTPPHYPGLHYRAKFLELCSFMAERLATADEAVKGQYQHELNEMQDFSPTELLALDLHFFRPVGLLIHRKFGSTIPALSIFDSIGVMETQTLHTNWETWLKHRQMLIMTLVDLVKEHGMDLGVWNDDFQPAHVFRDHHEFFFFRNTHKHASAIDAHTGEKLFSARAPNYLTNGVFEGMLFMVAHAMAVLSQPYQLVSTEEINCSIARGTGNMIRATLETGELRRNPFPPKEHATLTAFLMALGMAYGRKLAKEGYEEDIHRLKPAERGLFKSVDSEESLFMTARTLDMCYLVPVGEGKYRIKPPLEYFKRNESIESVGDELGYPFGDRPQAVVLRELQDLFSQSIVDGRTGKIAWSDRIERPATVLTGILPAPAFEPYPLGQLLQPHAKAGLGAKTPETAYPAAVSLLVRTLERTGLVDPALIRDLEKALQSRELMSEGIISHPGRS